MRVYFVYMLTNRHRNVLYTGVTRDLLRRVGQHREGQFSSFTQRYSVHTLVWYEVHHNILAAIQQEKKIKKWRRPWKDALIEKDNPNWRDLFDDLQP